MLSKMVKWNTVSSIFMEKSNRCSNNKNTSNTIFISLTVFKEQMIKIGEPDCGSPILVKTVFILNCNLKVHLLIIIQLTLRCKLHVEVYLN